MLCSAYNACLLNRARATSDQGSSVGLPRLATYASRELSRQRERPPGVRLPTPAEASLVQQSVSNLWAHTPLFIPLERPAAQATKPPPRYACAHNRAPPTPISLAQWDLPKHIWVALTSRAHTEGAGNCPWVASACSLPMIADISVWKATLATQKAHTRSHQPVYAVNTWGGAPQSGYRTNATCVCRQPTSTEQRPFNPLRCRRCAASPGDADERQHRGST